MGVTNIQVYAGLTRDTKPTRHHNAQGGCCAVFTGGPGFLQGGQSMDVSFNGYDFKEAPDLFQSRLIQSLVPGTSFVARAGQTVDGKAYGYGTIHVPFYNVPADQVSCVLRMAKTWFGGYHANAIVIVKTQFPELSPEDQAALAIILGTFEADSDGGVSFISGTCKSIQESGGYSNGGSQFTPVSVVELLKGNTRPGKQPAFQIHGYFKAGFVRSVVMQKQPVEYLRQQGYSKFIAEATQAYGEDDAPTANYPVILLGGEKEPALRYANVNGNTKTLKEWLAKKGTTLAELIKGNAEATTSESAMELPQGSAGGGSESSKVKPSKSQGASSASSSQSPSTASSSAQPSTSATRPGQRSIDWSQAPRGTQRAFLNNDGRPVFMKRSRATGIYYWHDGGDRSNWITYRSQDLATSRYATATPKPRNRAPQVTEEQRQRWARAPEGATHYSFHPSLYSRWLREDGNNQYWWSHPEDHRNFALGSWTNYGATSHSERVNDHFRNAEPRPAGL